MFNRNKKYYDGITPDSVRNAINDIFDELRTNQDDRIREIETRMYWCRRCIEIVSYFRNDLPADVFITFMMEEGCYPSLPIEIGEILRKNDWRKNGALTHMMLKNERLIK